MLNIFIGKDNLPVGSTYILDNEKFFRTHRISYDAFAKQVIRNVEHGSYLDDIRFLDAFGISLYVDFFSTGTKTLLNINSYKELVFNCDEIGDNALQEVLVLQEGKIYFSEPRYQLSELVNWDKIEGIVVNPKICSSYEEMNMEV